MKYRSPLLKTFSYVAVAALSASAAVVVVTHAAKEKLPLAWKLGIGPIEEYKPVQVNVADIPGSYSEKLALLAKIEPRTAQWDRLVVSGLRESTQQAPIGEIANAPVEFFQPTDKPLVACLIKIVMLSSIAERSTTETLSPEERSKIANLLDQIEPCGTRYLELCQIETAKARRFGMSAFSDQTGRIQDVMARVKAAAATLRS